MNKFLNIAITFLCFCLVIIPTSTALAKTETKEEVILEQEPIKLYYEDFINEEELELEITNLLNDDSVSGVLVVHKNEKNPIYTSAFPIGQWRNWKNGKIRYNGKKEDTFGSTINTVAGDPGLTIQLDYKKAHSATYSGNFGLNATGITMAVGFSVTSSYEVSYKGSYKVPKKHNGKKVKRAQLNGKIVYANHSYTVKSPSYPQGKTGTAKKPYGVYYQKNITYK
ncbi:hypothetical protein HXA35_15405 [Bacillus sp. A301a_S52]|jgi:hypothetical protein|nr:hypothetical protein [Bacillus sp. A301a_S52]